MTAAQGANQAMLALIRSFEAQRRQSLNMHVELHFKLLERRRTNANDAIEDSWKELETDLLAMNRSKFIEQREKFATILLHTSGKGYNCF